MDQRSTAQKVMTTLMYVPALLIFCLTLSLLIPSLSSSNTRSPLVLDSSFGGEQVTANPLIQKYLGIASQYWHISPSQVARDNNCNSYVVVSAPLVSLSPDAYAEAGKPGCWMRLSPNLWQSLLYETHQSDQMVISQYGMFSLRIGCVAVVHEFGHSTGHGHAPDPSSVMNATPTANSVPACTAAFPD